MNIRRLGRRISGKSLRPFVGLFLLFPVILLGRGVWNLYSKEQNVKDELANLLTQQSELQNRHSFLEGQIEKLQTSEGLEYELRKKFGVARAGEQVVVIVDEKEQATPVATSTEGFWQKLKALFGL